jgi:hypothetical protein
MSYQQYQRNNQQYNRNYNQQSQYDYKNYGMQQNMMRRQVTQRQPPQQILQPGYSELPSPIGTEGQYILYYSNYCINCKEFINILCKSSVYSNFTKINISSRNINFPSFVKSVPTIVVPKVIKPLVGKEVFQWLENLSSKQSKKQQVGITPYSPDEMSAGLGDNYSYLDVKDTDQPMEHTFAFVKRGEQKINTPAEESFISTKPKPIKEINRMNRPPLPQAPQRQMAQSHGLGGKPPSMIPQSSTSGEDKNVEDAYNELLARRKLNV